VVNIVDARCNHEVYIGIIKFYVGLLMSCSKFNMDESPFSKPYSVKKKTSLLLCSYEKYVTRDYTIIIITIIIICFSRLDG